MILEKGKLTEEGLKELRSRIGSYFRGGRINIWIYV
jgi:hypothetical protein